MSSPVVKSCYNDDGQYFCYVSVELDKQRVSVVPAHGYDSSVELPSLMLDSGVHVSCLSWFDMDIQCVLVGLSNGEAWVYSPLANEIVAKLSTGNGNSIVSMDSDSKFIWCCDSQDYIYKFDGKSFVLVNRFKLESVVDLNQLTIFDDSHLLVASHSIYLINHAEQTVELTYPGHIQPVIQLKKLNDQFFVSAGASDRFLNIYDVKTGQTKSILVANADVTSFQNTNDKDIIAITEDGTAELFKDVLLSSDVSNTKKRSRVKKSKQATKLIKVVRKDSTASKLLLNNAHLNQNQASLVWFVNATVPRFYQVNTDDIPADYEVQVESNLKQKNFSESRSLYGDDSASAKTYKEGNATVTSGDNYRHVTEAIKEWELDLQEKAKTGDEDTTGEEETLQDRLEASNFSNLSSKLSKHLKNAQDGDKLTKSAIVAGTVTTILAQALQSNDHSLLETVLNNRDERVIRDTILRLKAPLAIVLLERLAERIARQTHRQGPLNIWVKWCLIIHGGYLVQIPNLMSSLASLHSTLKKRSELLPRLLAIEARLNNVVISQNKEEVGEVTVEYDEDEDDVEYNEELDDAGLIDDGEEEEEEEDDEDEEDKEEIQEEGDDLNPSEQDNEEGYSDVEIE